ncbi:hypothetical protein [Rhizobium sp. NFR12]|uniref:hypothetical protein n=1 Tax=Rhizobium sp. NFR12 TaxID=1566261 RepID=UPI001114CB89|nr:hypothetical protein [Rhizobium sp. NFR12]
MFFIAVVAGREFPEFCHEVPEILFSRSGSRRLSKFSRIIGMDSFHLVWSVPASLIVGSLVRKIVATPTLNKAGQWGAGLLLLMPVISGLSFWWLIVELSAYDSHYGRWKVALFLTLVTSVASLAGIILLVIGRTLRIEFVD